MNQAQPQTKPYPLEGVKVLDFTWWQAGPISTKYLADTGATVVKVETIRRPCVTRISSPYKDNKPGIDRSGYFPLANAGKYSLALNISHPRGKEVLQHLVQWCDILIENFSPGTLEKWGLGYEACAKQNPGIIMMRLSLYGQWGPLSNLTGHGANLVGFGGFTSLTGWPDQDPVPPYGAYSDVLVSKLSGAMLVAALDHKRRTGKGVYLDVAQLEASLHYLAPAFLQYQATHQDVSRAGNRVAYAAPHGVYPCAGDDRWCAITVLSDEQWQRLVKALGSPKWAADPALVNLAGRKRREDEIDRRLAVWTRDKQARDVMETLQQAGVPAGIVSSGPDMLEDPQLTHWGYFQWLDHPEIGKYPHWGEAYHLSEASVGARAAAPLLGQHTEQVCREMLGMTDQEFVELLADGVFE